MKRLLLALASTLFALALGLVVLTLARGWPPFGGTRPVDLVDGPEKLGAPTSTVAGTANVSGRGVFRIFPVEESTARRLFVMHKNSFAFDPEVYFRYRPGMDERIGWPEHPDGAFLRRTNSLGLREDSDEDFRDADLRLLVTGDSHTDGVCNNSESFPSLLEDELEAAVPGRRVVALNTGVVGYSFYNYLGVLEEALAGAHGARPDVFVVAVYGGNDFLEALRPQHHFRGTHLPPRRSSYWDRIEQAKRVSTTALAQGLNQVAYFVEQPDQVEVALEAARAVLGEIVKRCREHDIRLCIVHIPPAFELPLEGTRPGLQKALDVLEIQPGDVDLSARLEQVMAGHLEALGVDYIDLRERFLSSGESCYWRSDLHLDLSGHRLVAEAVCELLERPAASDTVEVVPPPGDGPFEQRDASGAVVRSGTYEGGLRTGTWRELHPDGQLRSEGEYREGRRFGPWSWWYPDGQLLKQGRYGSLGKEGVWREWYSGGALRREGAWSDGLPEGDWTEWHPDGSLLSRGVQAGGEYVGTMETYHPGGTLETRVAWEGGSLEGPASGWHPDGTLRWEGTYLSGESHGQWDQYHPDGSLRSTGQMRRGLRQGPQLIYTPAGDLDEEQSGFFMDGERLRALNSRERTALGLESATRR